MPDCCSTIVQHDSENSGSEWCPSCNGKGKQVKIITLKSMLNPSVLDSLNSSLIHYFCSTKNCEIVYFNTDQRVYYTSDIKVSVHQKDHSSNVPVCYCFGWTKEKIKKYFEKKLTPDPIDHIRENIKKDRCGCEINNPQGSCCLANVTRYIKELTIE